MFISKKIMLPMPQSEQIVAIQATPCMNRLSRVANGTFSDNNVKHAHRLNST